MADAAFVVAGRNHLYPLVQRNFQAQVQAAKVVILEDTDITPRALDDLGEGSCRANAKSDLVGQDGLI